MRAIATLIGSLMVAGAAHAAPLNATFNVNLWYGTNPNPGDSTDPSQQALPTNTLTSTGTLINVTYTGPLDFSVLSDADNFLDEFIPGVGLPHQLMSSAPYTDTTVFEFTWIQPTTSGGTLSHDDGVSLFDITTNSTNLIPGNSAPAPLQVTTLPTLIAGDNYELWYVAANSAPSILVLDLGTTVTEPGVLGVLGVGLLGLGFVARRRVGEGKVAFASLFALLFGFLGSGGSGNAGCLRGAGVTCNLGCSNRIRGTFLAKLVHGDRHESICDIRAEGPVSEG